MVAYSLAQANLKLRRIVVADCVNPLPVTRTAWRSVAVSTSSAIFEIEVICSDASELGRRIESRVSDIPGHVPPNWDLVLAHHYEPWAEPRTIIDTAVLGVDEASRTICT